MSLALFVIANAGCASTGRVGIITRSFPTESDAAILLQTGRNVETLGVVEGQACRHLILVAIPWGGGSIGWGTATLSAALEKALAVRGGEAVLNAVVTTSLYNFIVYALTCTTVRGTAIRFH